VVMVKWQSVNYELRYKFMKVKVGPTPDRNAGKINEALTGYLKKNDSGNKVSLAGLAKQLGERREKVLEEDEG